MAVTGQPRQDDRPRRRRRAGRRRIATEVERPVPVRAVAVRAVHVKRWDVHVNWVVRVPWRVGRSVRVRAVRVRAVVVRIVWVVGVHRNMNVRHLATKELTALITPRTNKEVTVLTQQLLLRHRQIFPGDLRVGNLLLHVGRHGRHARQLGSGGQAHVVGHNAVVIVGTVGTVRAIRCALRAIGRAVHTVEHGFVTVQQFVTAQAPPIAAARVLLLVVDRVRILAHKAVVERR